MKTKGKTVSTSGEGTVVSFRLDRERVAQLRAVAEAEDRSVSYIARSFVVRGLSERPIGDEREAA